MKTGYLTVIFALACAACTPRFYPPKVDVPDGYLYGEGFPRDTAALASDWWRLFGDTEDARFIGRCCFIPADDGNLVKAEFVTQGVHEEYVALQMSVINRADGVIDKTLLRFGDYFSRNSRGQTPYIRCDSGKHEWYGPPPQTKDWNALRDAASDYVLTFSEDFGMGGM